VEEPARAHRKILQVRSARGLQSGGMTVYYIGSYDITDLEEFEKYPPRVGALLARYGGRVLASDLAAVCLEGTARTMNAIIEFPSREAAMGLYNDPEYQREVRSIRLRSTTNCTMVLVKQFAR
jgi:uncharacterized protein (DUF1330 family)